MKVESVSGIVNGVTQSHSPNWDERPIEMEPEVIIIHAISLPPGQYGGGEIEALFCNTLVCEAHPYFDGLRELKVSAHFLIRRDGETIQFVPTIKRAWHAGESYCIGRENVNDFSIGIELEGCDGDIFEDAQYLSLNELIECLQSEYPQLSRQRLFGHSDIAPGRKSDPGPFFDWTRVI